jgi:ribosomal protein S18 acetylase RimI-like enzyme
VIIRDARPDEHASVGELRVSAYRALGLLAEGSGYAETLRGFGFAGHCTVIVAVDEADDGILGTITLEPFEPSSELARDETEADIRAFAVASRAQGLGVGRTLLLAVMARAQERGLRRLRLCTLPAMRAAQHLYEATGFSRTPELDFPATPGLILRAYELDLRARPLSRPRPGPVPASPAPARARGVSATPIFSVREVFEGAF